jgi:hypothetical protein
MPLTLIVLGYLWKVFATADIATEAPEKSDNVSASPRLSFSFSPFLLGLVAGLLPLIHLHSLAVLFVVGLFLFILRPEKWIVWASFAAGVALIAVPELLWSISGSASETTKFFAWHFGWDKGERNFLWFWFTNTGILIPLVVAGLYLISLPQKLEEEIPPRGRGAKKKAKANTEDRSSFTVYDSPLLWFYAPFAFLFLVSNTAKLAPWEWDNIKVLIYWFVGSIPIVALLISRIWRQRATAFKVLAAILFCVLIATGMLDVWRTVSGQINYKVFDKDAVEIAEQIKIRVVDRKAMFLNAPTYNSAIVLTGRRSLMRYPGHLSSHGIDYGEREADVKRIYQGGPDAPALLEKHGIEYVLISPEEKALGGVNEQFFSRFPVTAESGQYKVFRIK